MTPLYAEKLSSYSSVHKANFIVGTVHPAVAEKLMGDYDYGDYGT